MRRLLAQLGKDAPLANRRRRRSRRPTRPRRAV